MTRSVVASNPEPLVARRRNRPSAQSGTGIAAPCPGSDALDVICLAAVIALIGATLIFVL
jgi:hypothetical protein